MLLVMAFSCGNKNENNADKNSKDEKNTAEQSKQSQKSDSEKFNNEEQKKYLQELGEHEAEYEKQLMEIKISGYNDSKQLSENDVREIKEILRKKFDRIVLAAATKDGRFYIIEAVTDGKNKEQTAKEVAVDRPDIIDTIGEWCEKKGIEYKVIFTQFYDTAQDKKISQSVYHSRIMEIQYEDEEYKDALRESFSKYKRATRY